MDPALLTPTLSGKPSEPIFSKTALFASAFIGGPFAVTLMFAYNSRYLSRERRDTAWVLLGLLAAATSVVAMLVMTAHGDRDSAQIGRFVTRAAALLLWLLFSFVHAQPHRAQETFGAKPRKPWGSFFGCVFVGVGLTAMTSKLYEMAIGAA